MRQETTWKQENSSLLGPNKFPLFYSARELQLQPQPIPQQNKPLPSSSVLKQGTSDLFIPLATAGLFHRPALS